MKLAYNVKRQPITRRTLLSGAAVGSLVAAGTTLFGQETAPPRVKGPPVWLDMDQEELDDAYDQSVYAPNLRQIIDRWTTNSEGVRTRLGPPERRAYGPTRIEALDIYRTEHTNAPVNIFIHGGGWRVSVAEMYAFPAELFVQAGAHWVVPDFNWVQDVGDSLKPLADQVRRAVAWVYHNAESFGGDPNRIYVSGHSTGGHLAGVILTTDWQKLYDLPPDIVKGGLCCSGMFDLEPVRLSARRHYIKFTDKMVEALSPQRHLDKLNAPVIVAYGSLETPEFQRQSRDFAAAVKAAGRNAALLVGEGYNHFEIIETLGNPYSVLGRAVLEQMGLAET